MSRARNRKQLREAKAGELFAIADKKWDEGDLSAALELFMAAAMAGDGGALVNIGYFYDNGVGVPANHVTALYWYKRAYRRGESSAAINIGIIWRDQGNLQRAVSWFKRGIRMGDDGGHLEIAKIYLRAPADISKAVTHLEKVCESDRVSEAEEEEAQRLLKQIRRRAKVSTKKPTVAKKVWLQ